MLHERALAICEKTLGSEHPLTVDIIRSLAGVYFEANEIAESGTTCRSRCGDQ